MAQYDTVIKNGTIIDGTGLPRFRGDIAIHGGRIAKIGKIDDTEGAEVIDATGLIVAPGFVDLHTHYDAQITWDPALNPSSSLGVSTTIMGNCGFTLYPAKPEDVDWLAGMLTRVEGMSREAMAEGFRWGGGDFAQYWSRLDGKLGLNVGGYVGHCAVRRMVIDAHPGRRPGR